MDKYKLKIIRIGQVNVSMSLEERGIICMGLKGLRNYLRRILKEK
jgi:hypothetical protein